LSSNLSPAHVDYSLLSSVVSDLTEGGRIASAAAVKTVILRRSPDFDERALGFRKFVDYLEAAVRAGAVRLARDDRNHPCVFPPSASDAAIEQALRQSSSTVLETRRLKRELWRAVVEWEPTDYWRGWDRKHSRVFMAPRASSSQEPWLDDAERYVGLPVVSRDLQTEWMSEFTAAQIPDVKVKLAASLQPGADLGAFRAALAAHGLLDDWAQALQLHVHVHVQQWATAAKVPLQRLFESVSKRTPTDPVNVSGVATTERNVPQESVARPEVSFEESLRRRLHEVVDQMNGAELSVITVPARFLVGS